VAAHGVFGLLNSTPHSLAAASRTQHREPGDDSRTSARQPDGHSARLLRRMAIAALTSVA
jgi:hypothetical protein